MGYSQQKKQTQSPKWNNHTHLSNYTLKQLRSFIGSIHHWLKFILNLSNLSAPLRPLLSTKNSIKETKLKWSEEHIIAFVNIKKAIAMAIESRHFDTSKPTRVLCDASKNGLGAYVEQLLEKNWQPISFTGTFLNSNEQKYSSNELELLAEVR